MIWFLSQDGKDSAQFEQTILVTDGGYEILTLRPENDGKPHFMSQWWLLLKLWCACNRICTRIKNHVGMGEMIARRMCLLVLCLLGFCHGLWIPGRRFYSGGSSFSAVSGYSYDTRTFQQQVFCTIHNNASCSTITRNPSAVPGGPFQLSKHLFYI